jgi:hypothetical protein
VQIFDSGGEVMSKEFEAPLRPVVDSGNSRVEGWTVKAESPTVFTAPASDIETNSVTLHATINPEGFTTTYYFEWGLTTSYGNKVPIPPESIGSGLSNVLVEQGIAGLAEKTVYHFRAVAERRSGHDNRKRPDL